MYKRKYRRSYIYCLGKYCWFFAKHVKNCHLCGALSETYTLLSLPILSIDNNIFLFISECSILSSHSLFLLYKIIYIINLSTNNYLKYEFYGGIIMKNFILILSVLIIALF